VNAGAEAAIELHTGKIVAPVTVGALRPDSTSATWAAGNVALADGRWTLKMSESAVSDVASTRIFVIRE